MPSLVAFGRRWSIASDDFVFPQLTEAFVRGAWVAFCLMVVIVHYPLECQDGNVTREVVMLLALNISTMFICIAIVWVSSRGYIMDARPRKHVGTLLYIRVPVFFIEVVSTCLSSYLIFEGAELCDFRTAIRITVILEWLLIFAVILGVVMVFNPHYEDNIEDAALIARRSWSRRFRLLKIRQDSVMRTAIDDIANLISTFFADGDFVLSDIAAGLLLVVHSPRNTYSPICLMDERNRPSWMNASSALHFMHFANCVYGWRTYLMHNIGCKPYLRLWRKMRCCGGMRCDREDVLVIEDNCCACNSAAFMLSTETNNIDLFFISFKNGLYETPFVVLADHDSRSIVVTIRGSCSLADLATDMCLDDEVLSVDVDVDPVLRSDPGLDPSPGEEEVRVHRGMLRSARYVYDTLRKHEVLSDMFVLNPDYQLVVCGHSLGAGVASLLTLLLRQSYPGIRCYAFAPPGCVISASGQAEMRQHVMSIVTGDDVVPRISYQSMHKLRDLVDHELNACRKAKYEILIKGMYRLFFHTPWDVGVTVTSSGRDSDQLISEDGVERRMYGAGLEGAASIGAPRRTVSVVQPRIQLYAPGRILYIAEDCETECMTREWIEPACLSDIKLSASVVTDHLPKAVLRLLHRTVQEETRNTVATPEMDTPPLTPPTGEEALDEQQDLVTV